MTTRSLEVAQRTRKVMKSRWWGHRRRWWRALCFTRRKRVIWNTSHSIHRRSWSRWESQRDHQRQRAKLIRISTPSPSKKWTLSTCSPKSKNREWQMMRPCRFSTTTTSLVVYNLARKRKLLKIILRSWKRRPSRCWARLIKVKLSKRMKSKWRKQKGRQHLRERDTATWTG